MGRFVVKGEAVGERDFFADVMDVVRSIPEGRVTSYGAIARYLGATRSSRLVGYCMNRSHALSPPVPAHRVLNRNGLLTGKHHFATPHRMQELLEAEGVRVVDDRVLDHERLFWDPAVELRVED
jgi:methylated-DNA-protein-cysteine methyltransferase related protein